MREDFDSWWSNEGQHSELCGEELCLIAWSNAEYKAIYPTKALTDEEIQDFIATFPIIFTPSDLVTFARAILRKAQKQ